MDEERGPLGFKIGPIRRFLRRRFLSEKEKKEDEFQSLIEKWRRDGIPEPMIKKAVEMADEWVYGQLEAIKLGKLERGLAGVAPKGKKPKKEIIKRYNEAFLKGE